MSGRAPFQVGILRPFHGLQRSGEKLRDFILEEIEFSVRSEFGIARKVSKRVRRRAETVHEEEARSFGARVGAQPEDLAGDEVEEGESVFDRNERLGFFQPHAGAQSAVEFDHAEPVEQGGIGRCGLDVDQGRNAVGGIDRVLGHEARLAGCRLAPGAFEAGTGGGRQCGFPHFSQSFLESALVHGRVRISWSRRYTAHGAA